ncbi:MAG: hypothetical protein ABQ298_02430 [Puniceicoccaceae bacterium]
MENVKSLPTDNQATDKEIDKANAERYAEPENELLYSLKSTIDRSGRYNYRLEDFSLGYAAGAGMSSRAAKRELSEKFERQFGLSPKQYLERSFEQNRANRRAQAGRQSEQSRSEERTRER